MMAYALPVSVGVSADRHWSCWKAGYFPAVAGAIGGDWLGAWLMVGGLFSAMGLFTALLLTSSRVPYSTAVRAILLPCLSGSRLDFFGRLVI